MPAGEGLAMKLLGTALLSLAVFCLCCSGEDSTTVTSTPQPTGSTSSRSTTPSITTASTAKYTGTTLTPTTKDTTTAKDSVVNSTPQTTKASNESLTTSNGTTRGTGTSKPLLQSESSVTATSNSSLTITGQSGITTISKDVDKNDIPMPVIPPESTAEPKAQNDTGNSEHMQETSSHFSIIMPVIIALIVITLSVFLLISVYRLCWKTTPDRQENGTEQAPSDKENVKLISVKTTSPETGMSRFLALPSYDLPLDIIPFPLEPSKPIALVSGEE